MDFDRNRDARVRSAAFDWLGSQTLVYGDVLPRKVLAAGFEFDRKRVPLVSPQGIFKPAVIQVPLTITTSPNSKHDDAFRSDNLLHYSYRGENKFHNDNVGLRFAMTNELPLAYFHGIVPSRYMALWPVFVVGDDPDNLAFTVAVDDAIHLDLFSQSGRTGGQTSHIRREYVTSLARRRLHQRAFRERVLSAYSHQCAFCRLRHGELLEAAHIIPDSEPEGVPEVNNGLSLCRLHHAAFDRFFLGVRPDDLTIEVRGDVLVEHDGPTLLYAIQGLHRQRITLPRSSGDHPDTELLAERYDRFLEVASTL